MNDFYIANAIMTVAILFVMLVFIKGNGLLDIRSKRSFSVAIVTLIVAAVAEFLGVLWDGADPSFRIPHILVKCLELSICPVIPFAYADAFYPIRKKLVPIVFLSIHAILEMLSAFGGFIYYVDAANFYHHGDFYALYYVAYLTSTVFFTVQIRRFSSQHQDQKLTELIAVAIFTLGGIICQAVDTSLRIVWLSVSIGLTFLFLHYISILTQADPLTGLFTRGYLDQKMARLRKKTIILFFDLNGFKKINDEYGHSYGDTCLINAANLLRRSFGKVGLCYRYGGDEFCVVIEQKPEHLTQYMNVFMKNVERFQREVDARFPSISYGFCEWRPGDDLAQVLHRADINMYAHKRSE